MYEYIGGGAAYGFAMLRFQLSSEKREFAFSPLAAPATVHQLQQQQMYAAAAAAAAASSGDPAALACKPPLSPAAALRRDLESAGGASPPPPEEPAPAGRASAWRASRQKSFSGSFSANLPRRTSHDLPALARGPSAGSSHGYPGLGGGVGGGGGQGASGADVGQLKVPEVGPMKGADPD